MADSSEDFVVLDEGDVSDFNEENILPEDDVTLQDIKKWLQPTSYDIDGSEFKKHLQSHLAGTGDWLLSSDTYRTWHDSTEHGTLWLKGIPGSGKSVFAAAIAELLMREDVPVLFFFFRQIIDANHEPRALLRDWLTQILHRSPPLQARLKKLMKGRKALESISLDDLWQMLRRILSSQKKVYCVADALDEVDQGNDAFLQQLATLGSWMPGNVKVLLTSRPVPSVEVPLRAVSTLELRLEERQVDRDIAMYVEHRLSNVPIALQERNSIKAAVPGRANGLFLYAKLAMDAFTEPNANVQAALKELPLDINMMYTVLLSEHARRSQLPNEVQLHILQWATHATRPLRLIEMAEMLSTFPGPSQKLDLRARKELVRAACGPLLEILPDETISVVHHTLTEFLKGTTQQSIPANDPSNGFPVLRANTTHSQLALSCLRYLNTVSTSEENNALMAEQVKQLTRFDSRHKVGKQLRMQYPFIDYASSNWHIHVVKASHAEADLSQFHEQMTAFFGDQIRFYAWLHLVWPKKPTPKVTPLHVVAWAGLKRYAEILLSRGAAIDACDGGDRTPLHWAASYGHPELARVLLEHGAAPDPDDRIGLKPLHNAASNNHPLVVRALLKAGVNSLTEKTKESGPRLCGNMARTTGHTALMYACENGHDAVVGEFLPYLHDIEDVHRALCWSARACQSKNVQLILNHAGVDVDAKPKGDSALFLACQERNTECMKILLGAGANPNLRCENSGSEFAGRGGRRWVPGLNNDDDFSACGYTPLHAFCGIDSNDYGEVKSSRTGVMMLLGKGALIDATGPEGQTPLHYACSGRLYSKSSDNIIGLLLEAGANPNATDTRGDTPLFKCSSNTEAMANLLSYGADVNHRSFSDGRTALLRLLAESFSGETVQELLTHGADCSLTDANGDGPLHIASRSYMMLREPTLVNSLLQHGADPNLRNHKGQTPMHLAKSEMIKKFDLLIQAGADINARDHTGRSVLAYHLPVGRLRGEGREYFDALLRLGASINCVDYQGRNLLFQGLTQEGGPAHMPTLHSVGLNATARDYGGNTLFHELATRFENKFTLDNTVSSLFDMLLEWGVDPAAPNNEGLTPLHAVARSPPYSSGQRPDERLLLDALLEVTKDVNPRDNKGQTPLHVAATHSELQVVKLLSAGADLTLQSFEGLSALHFAARKGGSNVVGLMLESLRDKDLLRLVDLKDRSDCTALHYACSFGRLESVSLLLQAGADPNVKASSKMTALLACLEPDMQQKPVFASHCAELGLLGLGRPACARPTEHFDDRHARLNEMFDLLVAHGASVEKHGRALVEAMTDAIFHGREYKARCIQRLLASIGHDPMVKASRSGFWETLLSFRASSVVQAFDTSEVLSSGNLFNKDQVFRDLLVRREYGAIEHMATRGADFGRPVAPPYGLRAATGFHLLTQLGHADLLSKTCFTDSAARFEDRKLYEEGEIFANCGRDGITPLLMEACERELPNMRVVDFLVKDLHVNVNGQYVRQVSGDGGTVLHILAKGRHWWQVAEALPYLITAGANMEARNESGKTPLQVALDGQHYSAGYMHERAAETLVVAGADVNALDPKGKSCLSIAGNNTRLIRLLVEHGATFAPDALITAAVSHNIEVVDMLLAMGADPNQRWDNRPKTEESRGNTYFDRKTEEVEKHWWHPVHLAAGWYQKGSMDHLVNTTENRERAVAVLRSLLAHGADPFGTFKLRINTWDVPLEDENLYFSKSTLLKSHHVERTILHHALEQRYIVEPFLELPGLDVEHRDAQGRTLLLAACLSRPDASIDAVVNHGKSIDTGRPSIFQKLLDRGADVSAVDNQGHNVLHLMLSSFEYESAKACDKSLETAISLRPGLCKQMDSDGETPLHQALRRSDFPSVTRMLDAGADASQPDKDGNTALHHLAGAMAAKGVKQVQQLFERFLALSLDMNARNKGGLTPLLCYFTPQSSRSCAPTLRVSEIVYLHSHGAEVFARNASGSTALHILAAQVWTEEEKFSTLGEREEKPQVMLKVFRHVMGFGLDVMDEDYRHRTVLDIAAAAGNETVLSLFERKDQGVCRMWQQK